MSISTYTPFLEILENIIMAKTALQEQEDYHLQDNPADQQDANEHLRESFCTRFSSAAWRTTTTVCTSIGNIFYNINLSAATAGAATIGSLAVFSRQGKQLSKLIGVDFDVPEKLLQANILIVDPIIAYHYLTRVLKFHAPTTEVLIEADQITSYRHGISVPTPRNTSNNDRESVSFGKKALVILLLEGTTILPYIAFTVPPDDYNIALYSATLVIGSLVLYKLGKQYVVAVREHFTTQDLEESLEIVDVREHIDCKTIAMNSLLNTVTAFIVCSRLLGIELRNQQYADSQGFDEYMAWVTAFSVPLAVSIILQNNYFALGANNNLMLDPVAGNTCLNKCIVNVLSLASLFGQGVAYTAFMEECLKGFGVPIPHRLLHP